MKFEKGNKKGVRFGSGQDPTKGGRPKKMLTKFKETGYSKGQVRDTYSAIAGLTIEELQDVIDDRTTTVLEKVIATSFKTAIDNKDKGYNHIQSIVELFADKATQHNVTKLETVVKYDGKSDEELDALIKKKMEFSES